MLYLKKYLLSGLLLLSLVASTIPHRVMVYAQDTPSTQISVLAEPSVAFPTVTLSLGVYQSGQALQGLNSSNFEIIGEDYDNLTVTQEDSGAANIGFVIDLTLGTDVTLVQEVLRAYFQNANLFREGDTAYFVVTKDSSAQVTAATTNDQITAFINNLSTGSENYRYNASLEALANRFTTDQVSGQIILIGSLFFFSNDATAIATTAGRLFTEQGIRVHAIQAHGSRSRFTPNFQAAAQAGNGFSAEYRNNQNSSNLQEIFNNTQLNRTTYTLQYDTLSGASGTRNVEIQANIGGSSIATPFSYSAPPLSAPRVRIIDPSANKRITRTQSDPNNPLSLEPTSQTVQAEISFPDTFQREISEATLIIQVDGSTLRQPIDNLSIDGNFTEFTWDLNEAGSITAGDVPVELTLEVTDLYQLVGSSSPVSITLANPPAAIDESTGAAVDGITPSNPANAQATIEALQATAIASGDPSLAATLQAEALATSQAFINTSTNDVNEIIRRANEEADKKADQQYLIMSIVGIALILITLASVFISRRRAKGGGGGGMRVYGDLQVIRGPYQGQLVEIDSSPFTIGRESEAGVDFATPDFAAVSAKHCSIIYRDGQFVIIDYGSSNGTFVDGQKIAPNRETPLSAQSTIKLGSDPRASVELRFYPAQALASSNAFKGHTMVEGMSNMGGYGQAQGSYGQPQNQAPYGNNPPAPYGGQAPAQGDVWHERTQPYTPAANQAPPPQSPYGAPPPNPYGAPPPPAYGGGQRPDNDWNVNPDDQSWLDS